MASLAQREYRTNTTDTATATESQEPQLIGEEGLLVLLQVVASGEEGLLVQLQVVASV